MSATIIVVREDQAQLVLDCERFQQQWQLLCEQCDWATPFQSPEFVLSWFECYRRTHVPLLLLCGASGASTTPEDLASDGYARLDAMMVLAQPKDGGSLRVAGTHHAEYQAWLERPGSGEFLPLFVAELARLNGTAIANIKYLPESSALEQVKTLGNVDLIAHPRPLWRLDPENISASLKKKGNKSKFNRLKRLGELEFVTITDPERFAQVLNDIEPYYDLRQGGANNSFPFHDDPLKKTFHIELMKRCPDFFHVTAIMLDNHCVSIQIGINNGGQFHLAIGAHAPHLSRHSPGKMHLLLLAEQLLSEDYLMLDLTPGGDPWKERFATDHDSVYELVIYPTAAAKAQAASAERRLQSAKAVLAKIHVTPDQVRTLVSGVRRIAPGKLPGVLLKKVRNVAWYSTEFRIYQQILTPVADGSQAQPASDHVRINKDCVSDLLLFEPVEHWQTRQLFAQEAMARLEKGEHAYTVVQNGTLVHYGWLIEKQSKAYFSEVEQNFDYPVPGAVLYDFYTSPAARGQGLYQQNITRMLDDAANEYKAKCAYISCLADNAPSRHVIEKLGFVPQQTLHLQKRFGTVKKW